MMDAKPTSPGAGLEGVKLALFLAAAAIYAAHVVRRQPAGLVRLVYSSPLFLLFVTAPLPFQQVCPPS
jgi:hypothetical protein